MFRTLFIDMSFSRLGHPAEAVHDGLYSVLIDQELQPNLDLPAFLLRFLLPFHLPFHIYQRIGLTDLDAHRLRQRRYALTHVAFQRQAGIGFDEIIPRWTGSAAEAALAVLLALDRIDVPAVAFGGGIISGPYRNIFVVQLIDHDPYPGPRRIDAAVFRRGMKCGARHFASATARAFIDVDLYLFDDLRCSTLHGQTSNLICALIPPRQPLPERVRLPPRSLFLPDHRPRNPYRAFPGSPWSECPRCSSP